MSEKPKCITAACVKESRTRGLCNACYQAYKYAILKRKLTEQKAVELGLILPPVFGTRRSNTVFASALATKLKEAGQ